MVIFLILYAFYAYGQTKVAPGVSYREIKFDEGPVAIQVLEVKTDDSKLEFGVNIGDEYIIGLESLDSMTIRLSKSEEPVIAAVNGDFCDQGRTVPG